MSKKSLVGCEVSNSREECPNMYIARTMARYSKPVAILILTLILNF